MSHPKTACHSLRLPFTFDAALLRRDLALFAGREWSWHFTSRDYSGEWTSLALYSASGEEKDIRTGASGRFRPTPLAERCAYFKGDRQIVSLRGGIPAPAAARARQRHP